jgi:sRNA-binding regulator protein Hfq
LAEFLSKATGTAVDWVQMPGMKVVFINYFLICINSTSSLVYSFSVSTFSPSE